MKGRSTESIKVYIKWQIQEDQAGGIGASGMVIVLEERRSKSPKPKKYDCKSIRL